ncbi:MAG: glycosyltransferase [Ruegeria sp.]
MVEQNLLNLVSAQPIAHSMPRKPLGIGLVSRGAITQSQLQQALKLQTTQNTQLGEIIVGQGWTDRGAVLDALSEQSGVPIADLQNIVPSPKLCEIKPVEFWLKHNVIPWMRMGPIILVATARPDHFDIVAEQLREDDLRFIPVLAESAQIDRAISACFSPALARFAETRVADNQSCRNWQPRPPAALIAFRAALLLVFLAAPATALALLFFLTVLTLIMFMALRVAGLLTFASNLFTVGDKCLNNYEADTRLPCVSVLVPLYKEREVASALIERLQRLTYPKALLDVILVLEEKDEVTRNTLADVTLPNWMRVVEVPDLNGLTTKPRAMNYALDFCRGEILGVWDAEDAPLPDQIEKVVDKFANAPDDVVCLQGALDFYNPRTNWRSRCFTIEYCSWFRVILPGIARMGLVVPLGGTTFFFKRNRLIELGGWDAHNVTEDADLGVRLCRAGYRTEILNTATYEEANFRAWPWVKQRSRWLKGFMVTYLVHMRAPLRLLKDLGPVKFFGVQAFFLGTLGQFLLAPVLWVFWLTFLGISQPFQHVFSSAALIGFSALFLAAELSNVLIGMVAVSSRERRFLIP